MPSTRFAFLCLVAGMLGACSETSGKRSLPEGGPDAAAPAPDAAGGAPDGKVRIAGFVRDAEGSKALADARLRVTDADARSAATGEFVLETGDTEPMLSAARSGYAETFRDLPPAGGSLDVYLKSLDERATFRGDTGVTVALPSGLKLEIPPNAVIDARGERVPGEVRLELAGIEGQIATQAAALPGNAVALQRDKSEGLLSIESGLSIVIRGSNDEELNVDAAAAVVVEAQARNTAAELGVYSFDPEQKRWREESKVARSTLGEENVYRADIDHLSWWSLGRFFSSTTCIRACVEDAQGQRVPGAQIWIVGASQSGVSTLFTDRSGCGAVDTIANANVVLVAQAGERVSPARRVSVGQLKAKADKNPSQCQDVGTLTLSSETPSCPLCDAQMEPSRMDAGISMDAGGIPDAGVMSVDTGAPDASVPDASAPDASAPDAGAIVVDCTTSGPHRYYASGQVTAPVTLRGKNNALTLTPESTYPGIGFVARYEPDTCFEWAVRVSQGGISNFTVDPANGAVYVVATAIASGASLYSADGTVGATFASNADEALNRSGNEAVVAKFNNAGQLEWAKRFGQTGTAGSARFTVQELILTDSDVRVVGFVNRTNSSASHDYIFGPGEAGQQIVSVRDNQIWSYAARFDRETGNYIAGSLDTFAAVGTANRGSRFDGSGNGRPNASGTYAYGVWPSNPTATPYVLTLNGTANNFDVGPGAVMMLINSARSLAFRRTASVDSSPRNMAVLANNESIWTGSVTLAALGPVSFETSTTPQSLTLGTQDEYLVRYTATGDIAWLKGVLADTGISFGLSGMQIAEDEDAIFFFGVANGTGNVSFGQGEPGALVYAVPYAKTNFLARYKLSTGAFEWIRSVQVPGNYVLLDIARIGGELILAARVDGAVTFDPGGPNQTLVTGARLGGAARYDLDGNFIAFANLADFGSATGGVSQVIAITP